MPDIRELTLLNQMDASKLAVSRASAFRARVRLGLRRFVVQTSVGPLRYLYSAIYRLHIRYALHVLRRFPGIHSIYLTGGLTSEIRPGISDIDIAVTGDWTDEEQMKVAHALQRLGALSPLFDPQLGINVHRISSLVSLYETDYFFQFRFNLGRTRWMRLHGEDLFALLPPIREEKIAGGYYSQVRGWWALFLKSAFGSGVTATDKLFRNSIAYKSVAGVQEMVLALEGKPVKASRREVVQDVLDETTNGEERSFLQRLQRSGDQRHLRFEGNIQEEAFRYLIVLMERIHLHLEQAGTFQEAAGDMHVDAAAEEMLVSPASRQHIDAMVAFVKRDWIGYRSAFLVPCVSFFYPDDLVLMIEVDSLQLPTVLQIRELCRRHVEAVPGLRQRVALFLLLPDGAYQLEILNSTEMWHHTLCAAANPEVFTLLNRPEFVLDGKAQSRERMPVWTRFADDQLMEEITLRRAAFSQAAEGAGALSSLDLLRNLWRQVQLEIMVRSAKGGHIVVPLTISAMLRALRSWGLPEDSIFSRLADAYRSEMEGVPVDAHAMLPEVMGLLVLFQ